LPKVFLGNDSASFTLNRYISIHTLPNKGGYPMTQVVVGQNENIESALRRFKRQVSKAGIFADIKRRRHFETPIEKRKRKAVARRKKRFR
jgi:small subunit ribosomal protein S21